jgi:hypothetical protein
MPNLPPRRSGQFRLTIPNTYSTITMPASLRSDCCSPSLRNGVRFPSGISVHLHRNTHRRPSAPQVFGTKIVHDKQASVAGCYLLVVKTDHRPTIARFHEPEARRFQCQSVKKEHAANYTAKQSYQVQNCSRSRTWFLDWHASIVTAFSRFEKALRARARPHQPSVTNAKGRARLKVP